MLLHIHIFIYVPIIRVLVLIPVLCRLLLISIVLSIYAFLSCVFSMFHLIHFGMSIIYSYHIRIPVMSLSIHILSMFSSYNSHVLYFPMIFIYCAFHKRYFHILFIYFIYHIFISYTLHIHFLYIYLSCIFMFMFMFIFQFSFMFLIIFMFSCSSMNLLYLEIGIIQIDSSKFKLWHFHAKLVILPILHSGLFGIPIFQCLDFVFDTGSLYYFEAKVLRVLLQLESPKSKHRNSRYDLINRDYSMFKTEQKLA